MRGEGREGYGKASDGTYRSDHAGVLVRVIQPHHKEDNAQAGDD